MRKVTPNNLKKLYQIYPAFLFSDVDIRTGRRETEAEIRSMAADACIISNFSVWISTD